MKLIDDETGETVEVPRTKLPIHLLVNGEFVEYAEGKYVRAAKVRDVEAGYYGSTLSMGPEEVGAALASDLPPRTILAALNMALQNGRDGVQP